MARITTIQPDSSDNDNDRRIRLGVLIFKGYKVKYRHALRFLK